MVANTEESRCNWRRTDYVNYTEGIGITYHGFEPEAEPERIDYIYIKKAKEGYAGLTCRSVKNGKTATKKYGFPTIIRFVRNLSG